MNEANSFDHDVHVSQPKIYIESLNVPLIVLSTANALNNAEQFNYERDKIVEITDENEHSFKSAQLNADDRSDEQYSDDISNAIRRLSAEREISNGEIVQRNAHDNCGNECQG